MRLVDERQGMRYAVSNVLCLFDTPRWASGVRVTATLAGEQRSAALWKTAVVLIVRIMYIM